MVNRFTTVETGLAGRHAPSPNNCRLADGSRYRHILVPTRLSPDDLPAFRLGMDFALTHRASLTLLHVLPPPVEEKSLHWLDAIDQLHQSWNGSNGQHVSPHETDLAVRAQTQFREFLLSHIPTEVHDRVEIRLENRTGDVSESIARFVHENAADLVILSGGRPRWWRPLRSSHVRRVIQLLPEQCIVLLPGTSKSKGDVREVDLNNQSTKSISRIVNR